MTGRSTGRTAARVVTPERQLGTDASPGRPVPSRLLRLSRTLYNLAEQDMPRPGAGDGEPWPDAPEELEPVDEDDVMDDEMAFAVKLRRRPVLSYSRATFWPSPAGSVSADPLPQSDLRVSVRRPRTSDSIDPATGDITSDELGRLAAALDRIQGRALRASSRLEAFGLLEPVSEKQLATEAGVSASVLSRRRREIVETPWGCTPLEFFWWKRADGLDVTEARLLADLLLSEPTARDRTLARRVAEQSAAPNDVERRTDIIRKQVSIMRSLLPLLPTLSLLSRRLEDIDLEQIDELIDDALSQESSDRLARRGRALVHMALVGAFDDLSRSS